MKACLPKNHNGLFFNRNTNTIIRNFLVVITCHWFLCVSNGGQVTHFDVFQTLIALVTLFFRHCFRPVVCSRRSPLGKQALPRVSFSPTASTILPPDNPPEVDKIPKLAETHRLHRFHCLYSEVLCHLCNLWLFFPFYPLTNCPFLLIIGRC